MLYLTQSNADGVIVPYKKRRPAAVAYSVAAAALGIIALALGFKW